MKRLLCWLLGHKEKRTSHLMGGDTQWNRICKRCGATRLARKRKPKETPA